MFNGKYCNKITICNLVTVVTLSNQGNGAKNGYFNSQGNVLTGLSKIATNAYRPFTKVSVTSVRF